VVAPSLRNLRWDRIELSAVDRDHEAVWLSEGSTLVFAAIVRRSGQVPDHVLRSRFSYAYGSNIANDIRVLALLALVFLLMTAVWPLRRIRNLDALAATGTMAAVVLLNGGLVARMVAVSYPLMIYLAARCAWRAFVPRRPAAPARPLFDVIASRWSVGQRLRLLRIFAGAVVAIVVMVGMSSRGVVDVGYAVMEGATQMVHGLLPYGHTPNVLHGDTYPIGSYLLYVPLAALSPVRSFWDSADATLTVAVLAALLAAVAISISTRSCSSGRERVPRDYASRAAPLRAAIAFLCFPPMLVTISTGTTDIVLCAIFALAVVIWRRPGLSTSVLAAGAWFKLAPAVLLPLWLAARRGRELTRAIAAVVLVSVAAVAALVAIGGPGAVGEMLHAVSYQASRDSPDSLWYQIGSVPLQQLAQAATLALVVSGALVLRRERAFAADRSRVAALSGAIIVAVQLSASYWTFMYLTWALPFIVLSILAQDPVGTTGTVATRG
jgi:Glycosyltransferase family 87